MLIVITHKLCGVKKPSRYTQSAFPPAPFRLLSPGQKEVRDTVSENKPVQVHQKTRNEKQCGLSRNRIQGRRDTSAMQVHDEKFVCGKKGKKANMSGPGQDVTAQNIATPTLHPFLLSRKPV